MLSTAEPLPALPDSYVLSAGQIREFREQGYLLTPGVITPAEAASFRAVVAEAVGQHNTETRPLAARDTYGKAFLQIMNLWQTDERVRHFVLARRFAHLAADLLGVENVRIYHDQALFKEPGGRPTPWHQDQYYWPLDTEQTVTMWMPLVDISQEMGTLVFAANSHRRGTVFEQEISDRRWLTSATCASAASLPRRPPPCGPATPPGTTGPPCTAPRPTTRRRCAR